MADEEFKKILEKMTPRARQVLDLAQKEAIRFGHDHIGTEHLLLGLLALGEGVALNVLQGLGLNLGNLRNEVELLFGASGNTMQKGVLPYDQPAMDVIISSQTEAEFMKYNFIGTEHILLALLNYGECDAARLLTKMGIKTDDVRDAVAEALDPNFFDDEDSNEFSFKPPPGFTGSENSEQNALNAFGRELVSLAKEGKLDPVIGRENEIERVIQILCRRTKNNPVLIGEAGVGKTAILEGLAQSIYDETVPEILLNKKIFAIDLPLMVAGTKYRGQFEERIKAVIDEVTASKEIILFIDELHTLVGAGGAEGAMDAANIIKPALARGELQCVGATTLDEYRKGIEKDSALERRFQSVIVDPPSVDEAIQILKGLKKTYEEHHKVRYDVKALTACVKLSDRYISGRYLPDKAIDIMDETGSRIRLQNSVPPPNLEKENAELAKIDKDKIAAVADQQFEAAAKLRDKEKKVLAKKEKAVKAFNKKKKSSFVKVTESDIAEVIANLTKIPIQQMEDGENERLLNMEENIGKTIIGQPKPVSIISKALRRARADLKDPKRPIGSFIFLGPTGVGKTLLAKSLAEFIFGDSDALVQIDMSEYMEKFNVSRLVGSPPGYVGHGEGGELTERVRRKPYSVVLFDEIEKAHPDIMHLLLQILEEGNLTDSVGRKIDFRNTIIIMTSNIGAERAMKGGSLGFTTSEKNDSDKLADTLLEMAKKRFKPEFVNRLDDIIIFNKLDKPDLMKIVKIEIDKLVTRLKERGIKLKVGKKVYEYIIEKGFNPEYGARPLRRSVEQHIEDPLAEELLRGAFNKSKNVTVKIIKGKMLFVPA